MTWNSPWAIVGAAVIVASFFVMEFLESIVAAAAATATATAAGGRGSRELASGVAGAEQGSKPARRR